MSEEVLQSKFWQWTWNELPETRRLIFHVPNELEKLKGESEQSHMRRLLKARSMGVVPGVWDNVFLWKGNMHIIEAKIGKNDLSKNQILVGDAQAMHGAIRHKFYTIEEGQSIIKSIIQ